MPPTETHELAAFVATRYCYQINLWLPEYHSSCPEMSGWCDVGQFGVSVSLVGLGWSTVTTAVMLTMNVTEITD